METGWFSLSNLFDLVSAFLQGVIGVGLVTSYSLVKNATRPNNIGLGIWFKSQAQTMKELENKAKHLDRVSKVLAMITVSIQVGEGIYKDIKRNYSMDRIISNAIVNTAVYGVTTWAIGMIGGKIGGLIGSFIPIPIVGTVVGSAFGYAIGVGVGFLLNLEINGKSVIDYIGDTFYNFWKKIFD